MIKIMEKNIQEPINIGSGKGVSIKKLINVILSCKNIKNKPKIIFDRNKPSGDERRVLDTTLAIKNGISPKMKLKQGLEDTISWYIKNKNFDFKKYNYFNLN